MRSLPELDYWEVDPAWDGKVFRSAVQAIRPRKHHGIVSRLSLPAFPPQPGEKPVAVRLVTVQGSHLQAVLR